MTFRVPVYALEHAWNHARRVWPEESCGLLIRGWGGTVAYQPHRNLAGKPRTEFRLNTRRLQKALDRGQVLAVVHSHPDGSGPSETDRRAQKAMAVPWIVLPLSRDGDALLPLQPVLIDLDSESRKPTPGDAKTALAIMAGLAVAG